MRHRCGTWLAVLLSLRAVVAAAEPTISAEPALPEITRGQDVTVHGKDFPANDSGMVVYLSTGKEKPGDRIQLPARRVDSETLTFALPPDKVPVGRYVVSVGIAGIAGNELAVPGDLRILADASAPVHLDGVYPVTAYPTGHPGFDFEIAGQNLAAEAQNNIIVVVGRGPVPVGDADECEDSKKTGQYAKTCLYVDPGMKTRKVRVVNFPRAQYDGPIKIQVQVGNNVSTNALPLTFSRVSERGALFGALLTFGAIMLIVVWFVWRGVGDQTIGGKRYGPWTSFFLDKQTNTYSLSKFQLLVWTSVFVFGYVYLFFCQLLIQWKFALPALPDGLPGMLAISAGTAVAATGVTETRGSKGSGPVHPSAADFVSTGGVVAGERFQFFVWTLVGAFGFLSMLLLADPSTLNELPKIPDNLVYLMGISSVGYLAGKVTRKPGPVLKAIEISSVSPFTICLQGENLAKNATVTVDGKQLRSDEFSIEGTPVDQAPDPAFCSEVQVTLLAATAYLEGEHTLTLINGDGQAAAVHFPSDPLTIDSVEKVLHGTAAVPVKVTGKNFAEGMTAEWKDAAGTSTAIPSGQVTKTSVTELTVNLIPGDEVGTGTLTLISALGLRATKPVTIS